MIFLHLTVDCKWTEWILGECICNIGYKTSDSATQSKTREIKVKASNGGKGCIGSAEIIVPCNNPNCKGKLNL